LKFLSTILEPIRPIVCVKAKIVGTRDYVLFTIHEHFRLTILMVMAKYKEPMSIEVGLLFIVGLRPITIPKMFKCFV